MMDPRQILSFLQSPLPVWAALLLAGGLVLLLAVFAWQLNRMRKRLEAHSRSIGNMDQWADSVDEHLNWVEKQINAQSKADMYVRRIIRLGSSRGY